MSTSTKTKLTIIGVVIIAGAMTTMLIMRRNAEPSGPNYFPKRAWHLAGYATPDDAAQSLIWAASKADVKSLDASLTPDALTGFQELCKKDGQTQEQFLQEGATDLNEASGYQILKRTTNGGDDVVLKIMLTGMKDSTNSDADFKLHKTGDEWKVNEMPE